MRPRFQPALIPAVILLAARLAGAQSTTEHLALGDREYAAMNATAALAHYQAAAQAAPSAEALWKVARSEVDLGEFERDEAKRNAYFKTGEEYARRAVAANPGDAEAHFQLARAIGRTALTKGPRDRVKYGKEVRAEALQALKLDPRHPGALHVLGVWNAEIMRLNGPSRWFAKTFLGGSVFNEASWDNAVRYMQQSVEVDPKRVVHHLDLAKIYRDRGDKTRARAEFEEVLRLPATDYNDRFYKDEASAALKNLG